MIYLVSLVNKLGIQAVICTSLTLIFAFLLSKWQKNIKVCKLKKQHRCKLPTQYAHQDRVMGSDLTQLRMEAMKEGRFFKLYASQFEQYGRTWEENWRGKPLINITEPANVKQVAALSVNDYGKDPERAKAQSPFFGPSIFLDGHVWKEARGLVKPIFTRAEISDMDHLASFVDRFMDLLPNDGGMVDVQPLLHRLVSLIFRMQL
ncbi:hypothetical protein OCU04_006064 [Sclerotinia nivalis]|uniref:Cytochrome P450 alkane hydroxylase n=1 Tax=Sclerotinia nivalis TaxID=352851 RepID=A0A9X0AMD5_9HELO|nr:hypothetical protein OCU04_006064 [Sclerotinia nivalis]